MSRVNLGRVTMMPKGAWDNSLTYKRLDIVTNNGVSYIALQDVPANTVITNTSYWMAVTPNFSIGEVSTLNPSESASASITSTSTGELNLNLGIPRGISGNETIDDSAGLGDIDVVWSANKTKTEVNSKQNAVTKSVSGSIVSFDDAIEAPVTNAVVNIEPVQDLHGYDNPWPAGGGKNLLPLSLEDMKTLNTSGIWSGNVYTSNGIAFSVLTDDGENVIGVSTSGTATDRSNFILCETKANTLVADTQYRLSGCRNGSVESWIIWMQGHGTKESEMSTTGDGIFTASSTDATSKKRVSISIFANYAPNLVFKPMLRLGSITDDSFEPYSNVCPITGWDSTVVTRTGKNLYYCKKNGRTNNGVTFTVDNGKISFSGTATASTPWAFSTPNVSINNCQLFKAGTYTLSGSITDVRLHAYAISSESYNQIGSCRNGDTLTFTLDEDTFLFVNVSLTTSKTYSNTTLDIQLELGSTATAYEPYQGASVTIDLDGTRYGGELDVTNGVLTVDRKCVEFSGSGWLYHQNAQAYYRDINDRLTGRGINGTQKANWLKPTISDISDPTYITDSPNTVTFLYNTKRMFVNVKGISEITDIATFNTYLDNHPLQICYLLATPITYTLTPAELVTLLGENHIWADSGDISVDYQYDLNKALAEKVDYTAITDNIESTMTATRNYTAGEIIAVNNKLLRATANIASGGSITIGSNAEEVDIETLIAEKANKTSVYTKSETDTALALKANSADVYTKTQADDLLATKAPVITETASGSLVTIPDGAEGIPVQNLTVGIEPVQDLHGYSNPWPAGGGKNLFGPTDITLDGRSWTVDSNGYIKYGLTTDGRTYIYSNCQWTINLTAGTYYIYGESSNKPTSGSVFKVITSDDNTLKTIILNNSESISGSFTISEDQTVGILIKIVNESATSPYNYRFVIASESVSSWTPYSNVCPITGHTQTIVTKRGKNMCVQNTTVVYPYVKNGVTITKNQDSSMSLSGSNSGSEILLAISYLEKNMLDMLNGKAFLYGGSQQTENAQIIITYYKSDSSWLGAQRNLNGFILTVPNEADRARVQIRIVANASNIDGITLYPQLELSSTATDYEPYSNATLPITFPTEAGTVYGSTLDVTNGVLTVDRAYAEFDGSADEAWTIGGGYSSGIYRFGINLSDIEIWRNNNQPIPNFISNLYVTETANNTYRGRIGISMHGGSTTCYICDNYTSIEDWRAHLAETSLQIVYPLATPLTYQLTPQQLTTLLGTNNIWVDTGNVEIKYSADTKMYIEHLTKPTEDDMVANANIDNGKFFMVGNRLFLSTASISQGETIAPNTNCTELSLADALNNLNQ